MGFRSYKEIGIELLNWGTEDNGNFREHIRTLSTEQKIGCLLIAAVSHLKNIEISLLNLRIALREKKTGSSVSDGAIYWLTHSKDKRVDQMDKSTLSVRARKVIEQADIRFRSEVTEKNLDGRRNCGAKTMRELLEWAKP